MELGPRQIEWLEALESGDYDQTTKVLRDNTGFCCLGVACDLYDASRWQELSSEAGAYLYVDTLGTALEGTLPDEVKKYYGFMTEEGTPDAELLGGDDFRSLASVNDNGANFNELATRVRACPEAYFTESK